jgi:hypothetical protein
MKIMRELSASLVQTDPVRAAPTPTNIPMNSDPEIGKWKSQATDRFGSRFCPCLRTDKKNSRDSRRALILRGCLRKSITMSLAFASDSGDVFKAHFEFADWSWTSRGSAESERTRHPPRPAVGVTGDEHKA